MPRANDPSSREATKAVSGILFVAIIDVILLVLALMWLIFVCGSGTLVMDAATTLTLLHFVHLILILSACIVYPLDVLYVPFWFALIALGIAALDIFILVARSSAVFGGGVISLGCDFFMWLFDLIFLLLALGYLAFAARSTSWYGLMGDSDDVSDPFLMPRYGPVKGKVEPSPLDNIQFASATAKAAASAIVAGDNQDVFTKKAPNVAPPPPPNSAMRTPIVTSTSSAQRRKAIVSKLYD